MIATLKERIAISIDLFFIKPICTLFAKNPCKKCIIRACCSNWCEIKFEYNKLCDIEGNIGMMKFSAFFIIFGIATLFSAITLAVISI